ncbi:PAS domain S-box protein [Paradesertivirga mongoliensis]|uniref:histidine kinase n=1 Tax=Paradesertivirga mongoliensis TaxID=2100740 RepID=A0ABW4ZNB9_9SPHI|nr:PAS domain S-box protein [Pedobacter mongoliensis]
MSPDYPLGKKLVHPNWRQINAKGEPLGVEDLPSSITRSTGKIQKDFIVGLEASEKNIKWLSVNTQTLHHDNVDYVFSTFIDITEKHNLQEEVSRAKERLKYALKGSEIGVWEYNTEARELYFSNEWRKIIGYVPSEVDNPYEQWEQLIHPEDKDFVLKNVNDCLANLSPGFKIEYRIDTQKGDYKWVGAIGKITARAEDGTPKRFSGTIKDVTDQKKSEEAILASEQKFKNAFHYSAVGMGITDVEGRWIDVNPAFCEMLGYSKTELSKLTFREITHPEDLPECNLYVDKLKKSEIDTFKFEKRYLHKNGGIVWGLLTAAVMWRENNVPKSFIAQVVNISNTKALISQLEANNLQLNLTTIDLENKIEQLEEFNRIVAHNLRGPVGNILQLTDMISEDESLSELYMPMLKEATVGLDSTLKELIKILEIKLNADIAYQKCSFEEIISNVQKMLNIQIQNEKVSFKMNLEVPGIDYPTVYLESILYNLITNAIKYRRKNVKSQVVIHTYIKGGKIALEVSDNGLGIDLQRYGHQIFKLNKVFHKGFDSKGMGLFILKNQIETLGGTISVTSQPNRGSTFEVIF